MLHKLVRRGAQKHVKARHSGAVVLLWETEAEMEALPVHHGRDCLSAEQGETPRLVPAHTYV